PDIHIPKTSRTGAGKEHPVFITGKCRRRFVGGSIDDAAEVRRRSPCIFRARSLRKPDIKPPKTPRAIRSEIETEPVFRNRRNEVVRGTVDCRAEVRRHSPRRKIGPGGRLKCTQDDEGEAHYCSSDVRGARHKSSFWARAAACGRIFRP